MPTVLHVALAVSVLSALAACPAGAKPEPATGAAVANEFQTSFTYRPILGPEKPAKKVTRRDPSDVIRVGQTYYVWYTKTDKAADGYNATVWYATSDDGVKWTERGEALPRGGKGTWDEHSVFTPGILVARGKYYLFYTAVPEPFTNGGGGRSGTPTAIGIAVADSPDGPWTRFDKNPVLIPGKAPAFDSHRVDDSCLIVRDGTYWLYYKGRAAGLSPGQTKLGLAIADKPTGPYVKYEKNPVVGSGHEVLVWPHRKGTAALVTGAGPQRNTVQYAPDGIHFKPYARVRPPHAPGAYRPEAFTGAAFGTGITWGISHTSQRGSWPYLVRYDCKIVPTDQADQPPGKPMDLSAAATPGRPRPAGADMKPVVKTGPKPAGAIWFDFETGDLQGWKVVEGEFDKLITDRKMFRNRKGMPFNKEGRYHLDTVEATEGRPKDAMTGVIESPRFVLTAGKVTFRIGGGKHEDTYVALCTADGTEVLTARGAGDEVMRPVTWDASRWVSRDGTSPVLFLRVVDRHKGPWGHVTFDDFRAQGKLVK